MTCTAFPFKITNKLSPNCSSLLRNKIKKNLELICRSQWLWHRFVKAWPGAFPLLSFVAKQQEVISRTKMLDAFSCFCHKICHAKVIFYWMTLVSTCLPNNLPTNIQIYLSTFPLTYIPAYLPTYLSFRSVSVPKEVRFGILVGPFRSVPVRFGQFRSVSVSRDTAK